MRRRGAAGRPIPDRALTEKAPFPGYPRGMNDVVTGLEPAELWSIFSAISMIPRPSGHEAAVAAWLMARGRELGLEVEQDAVGNVLMRKAASPGCEAWPMVTLQAHMDMVCEKNEDVVHDFHRDPIRLRRDGDLLRATGTTLGADNGIGVSAGMAVLASRSLRHGPLELLLTVDEETGLAGASGLRPGWLRGQLLLNLDSEEEGFITIGCAGGVDSIATRRVRWEEASLGCASFRLKVSGLKGGHSGIDIGAGRANAIRLLAQSIAALRAELEVWLGNVRGGNKRNAIPREAFAVLTVDRGEVERLHTLVAAQEARWRAAFGSFDPHIRISLEPTALGPVMSEPDARALVDLLLAVPHGVEAMSPDIPGLVQTSTNLGVLQLSGEVLEVNLLTRSAIDSSKQALADRIDACCTLAGFHHERVGGYPGWKPEPGAPLVDLVSRVWREQTGKAVQVVAIHAGLECGLIGEKYPGLQMASFGPDMADVHTPDEHVSIPSVGRFWAWLTESLSRVGELAG